MTTTDSAVVTLRQALSLVSKAKPTKDELADLRRACDNLPAVYRFAGDLLGQAERHLLRDGVTMTAGQRLTVERYTQELRAQLGAEQAPALERLLIDAIVLAWLRLAFAEYAYSEKTKDGGSIDVLRYYEQRLSASQGRYLRAIEALARVRKLGITVQLNIATNGGQQVNVGGT